MWTSENNYPARGFLTPPPAWKSRQLPPEMPATERKPISSPARGDNFNLPYNLPADDSPYGRAKHVQLVDKNPSKAISMFWSAINSGDRVNSALKDMAVVMKQLNRSEEAIEAIRSFRHLCPSESQESLDNILVDLYKTSGRTGEQIDILQAKIKHIEEGYTFGGRRTKPARCQGKRIEITIEQEYARLLGNLGWAYLLQNNYKSAEEVYRKSLSFEQDKNKQCNLAICLMHLNKLVEAKFLLQVVSDSCKNGEIDESYAKSYERAVEVLAEFESNLFEKPVAYDEESRNRIPTPFSPFISCGPAEGSFQTCGQKRGTSIFFGTSKENTKCPSPRQRQCFQSSPQNLFADKCRGGYRSKRATFGSQWNDRWASTSRGNQSFGYQKGPCSSPVPAAGATASQVLLTQPRRGLWSFGTEEQKREVVQDVHRKLTFGQQMMPAEAIRKESSEGVITKQASADEVSIQKPNIAGSMKSSSSETDKQSSAGSEASMELQSQSKSPTRDKYRDFCMDNKSKKSWADIVEEEEQEQREKFLR